MEESIKYVHSCSTHIVGLNELSVPVESLAALSHMLNVTACSLLSN